MGNNSSKPKVFTKIKGFTRRAHPSGFFRKAKDFTVAGGTFTEVYGDVVHVHPPPVSKPEPLPMRPLKNPSPFFTGREEYIQRLKDHFDPHAPLPSKRSFLLHGMGGMGKTQICLKFIEEVEDWFDDIFWIDASTDASITLSFEQIAEAKGLVADGGPSVKYIIQWISNLKTSWLMVFDNADGGYELVENHLPVGDRGNVVITSRSKVLERITSSVSLEVGEMEEEEAITLLLKCAQLNPSCGDIAKKLVLELNCVPLAIDQAGAYMHGCQCDPGDYLELYTKHRKELLSDQPGFRAASGYGHSAYGTWDISVGEIERRASSTEPMATAAHTALIILNTFAFFHHETIFEDFFGKAAMHFKERSKEEQNDLPQASSLLDSEILHVDEEGEWNKFKFMSGIQLLLTFSLIKHNKRFYSIHPLVHAWSRERLTMPGLHVKWCKARAILSYVIKPNTNEDDWALCVMLIPHLKAVYKHGTDLLLDKSYCDDEYDRVAFVFDRGGEWTEAEIFQKQIMEIRKEKLGECHIDTLRSMNGLAKTYQSLGKLDEAEELQVKTVKLYKENFGLDHLETLDNMNNLANTYQHQGKLLRSSTDHD